MLDTIIHIFFAIVGFVVFATLYWAFKEGLRAFAEVYVETYMDDFIEVIEVTDEEDK